MDTRWEILQLKSQIEELERRVKQLENPNEWKVRDEPLDPACKVCTIEWSGTMGYVCTRSDCPMQTIVTCGNTGR
jgi:hypothetical protein